MISPIVAWGILTLAATNRSNGPPFQSRFKLEKSDLEDAVQPWKMRYSAMQNVTVNLPRIAFEAAGDDTKLFSLLTDKLTLAAEAHIQKKRLNRSNSKSKVH